MRIEFNLLTNIALFQRWTAFNIYNAIDFVIVIFLLKDNLWMNNMSWCSVWLFASNLKNYLRNTISARMIYHRKIRCFFMRQHFWQFNNRSKFWLVLIFISSIWINWAPDCHLILFCYISCMAFSRRLVCYTLFSDIKKDLTVDNFLSTVRSLYGGVLRIWTSGTSYS